MLKRENYNNIMELKNSKSRISMILQTIETTHYISQIS